MILGQYKVSWLYVFIIHVRIKTPCSKQAGYFKFKWLQQDSNPQTLIVRKRRLNHRTGKYSQHNSIIWSVWLNGWVFVYDLSGCAIESRCSHLSYLMQENTNKSSSLWKSRATFLLGILNIIAHIKIDSNHSLINDSSLKIDKHTHLIFKNSPFLLSLTY